MDHTKYSSSEPASSDYSMEWEDDNGTDGPNSCLGDAGTSSVDSNLTTNYAFIQKSTSGSTGQKRKSTFSNLLPAKFLRDIRNEKQPQEHISISETSSYKNQNDVAEFLIAPPTSQMIEKSSDVPSQVVSPKTSVVLASSNRVTFQQIPSMDVVSTVTGPTKPFYNFPNIDLVKRDQTNLMNAAEPPSVTIGSPTVTSGSPSVTAESPSITAGSPSFTALPSSITAAPSSITAGSPSLITAGSPSFTAAPSSITAGSPFVTGPTPDMQDQSAITKTLQEFFSKLKFPKPYKLSILRKHLNSHEIDAKFEVLTYFENLSPPNQWRCLICGMFVTV